MDFQCVPAVGGRFMVRISGPDSRHIVLLLPGSNDPSDVFDGVSQRLHNSDLKTVALESSVGITARDVVTILDELDMKWVHVVGNDDGADIAWELAASTFGRFASLVVIDRGHPALPDHEGAVRSPNCAAVEIPTTVLVSNSIRRSAADSSGRLVYGDFRVVQLEGTGNIPTAHVAALASEIVLRTSPW